MCDHYLILHPEELSNLWLVEADNHVSPDEDDRYTHLATLLNHGRAIFFVLRDIVFGISDIVGLEKFFGHLAEVAGRRGVN